MWFHDPRLAGDPLVPFGVNGIRINKDDGKLYVSVTARLFVVFDVFVDDKAQPLP